MFSTFPFRQEAPLYSLTQVSWGRCGSELRGLQAPSGEWKRSTRAELTKAPAASSPPLNFKTEGWEPSSSLGWKVGSLPVAGLCPAEKPLYGK